MTTVDYEGMTDGEMLAYLGTDAEKWAEAFCYFNPHLTETSAKPGDTIHGWFCNAIEAGRSAGYSEGVASGSMWCGASVVRRCFVAENLRGKSSVEVGQVYEDTYITNSKGPWLVRVMKLNEKSVRVEPCAEGGWYTTVGYEWQYRLERRHFESGRMRLVYDPEAKPFLLDAKAMYESAKEQRR